MVRAALYHWSRPYWKRLPGRAARPRRPRYRRVILKLERLENIEAPDSTVPIAVLSAAPLVHTAEPANPTPEVEKPSTVADTAMDSLTETDKTLADQIFSQATAQADAFSEGSRFLASADSFSSADEATERHTTKDAAFDPVMVAANALIDPLSNSAASAAEGAQGNAHHAGPSIGNGVASTPPNLAGAYAGAGRGPGGASTPFAAGGGSVGGGGGGNPVGGNLATLANEGAFTPQQTGALAATTTPAIASAAPSNAATTSTMKEPPAAVAKSLTADNSVRPADPDPPGSNLLVNGRFETGDFTGWTQGGNTGYTSVEPTIGNNSTYAAELGPIGSDGTLSQIIATNPGTVYQVRFDLASDGQTYNDFTATFAGQTLQSGTNLADFPYTTYTYNVTATSTSSTLEFTFRDDPSYLDLDNVFVGNANAPTANNDAYTLPHDTTLSVPAAGVLANDTDPNNLPLSAVRVTNAGHGNVDLNSDGSFTYTPNAHYKGPDSFTYYASNGQQNSNIATVNLTVTDTGTITTQPDSYNILHGQALNVDASSGVLANDSDSDGDSLTASLFSNAYYGSVSLNPDGSFVYTPNPDYAGPDSFQYTASDGVQASDPTTVNITVTDNAPTAIDHSYNVPENGTENIPAANGLLQGAADADGDSLTVSSSTPLANGSGSLQVNPDGSFTYTPNPGYTGQDSFQYTVSDGAQSSNTATVTLNVHSTDTAPVANDDSYSVLHDQDLTVPASTGVLANDSDADGDSLTVASYTQPGIGSVTVNPDGSFVYTPKPGYTGQDSFQYTASDGQLSSNPATVTITVTDPNAPVANDDSYTVERNNEFDADASTGVLANDTDADGDSLTVSSWTPLANGSGSLQVNPDGSFTYIPNNGFTGPDSFQYTVSDGAESSNTATVTLTVNASPPTAADQSFAVLQNTALNAPTGSLLLNAGNPDNMTLMAQDVTLPRNGTLNVLSDGSFVYQPNSGFTGSDFFTYDLSDGSLTSDPATVTITVKPNDTPPTATDLSYSVDQDTSLSTDATSGVLSGASDSDGDPLLAVLVSGPSDGTLTLNPDGSFTYTPNPGFYNTDSFQYEAFDGTSDSNVATVTLDVVEDVPVVVDDSYSVLASGPTTPTGSVLDNDSDPDGTPLTAMQESLPSYGSLQFNSDGTFTYMPNSSFPGSDSFTYEAYNGTAYSAPATVTLTSGPVASAQEYSVTHDQTLSVDAADGLLNGASDADGDPLTAAAASLPNHGSVAVNPDGSFTYTPDTHFVNTDSFTYTVSDGTNTSAPATVTIDVTDDVPTASPQSWDTPEGTPLSVNAASGVLASSSDEDGDSLTAQLVSGPNNGSLQLGSSGSFTYTPNPGFFGTDSFTYDATDGVSTSDPATVTITVDQVVSEKTPNSVYSAVATADHDTEVVVADQGLNSVSVFAVDSSGNLGALLSTPVVGLTPVALAVGDFNGDGNSDVAVANSGDGTVSILLGAGGGMFTTGTTLTGFNDPVAVVAGDFNNDGLTDLAVVNKGSNAVSILLGNGNGTFTPDGSLQTGNSPTSIAAANFNNDVDANNVPILDLVVTNSADNTVSVFLGNGDGTFQSPLTDTVGTAPMSVTTGAFFSGDNTVDLAVANSGSNDVSVLLGNGDGTFQEATSYAVGSDPVSIVAGNFDGNGYLDLSVTNKGDDTLSSLYNYGNGEFFAGYPYPALSEPVSIATGDFNHDGLMDQVVALADPKLVIKRGEYNAHAIFKPTGPVAVSSNGYVAASMNTLDNKVNIVKYWSLVTGVQGSEVLVSPTKLNRFTTAPVTVLAFSPDGNFLAMGSNLLQIIVVWDYKNNRATSLDPLPDDTIPVSLAFSPDGNTLVAATKTLGRLGMVYGWEIAKSTEPSFSTSLGKDETAHQVFFAPNLFSVDSSAVIWYDPKNPNQIQASVGATGGGSKPLASIVSAAKSPNALLAVGNSNSTVDLYSWNGGKALDKPLSRWKIINMNSPNLSLVFPSDGTLIALGPTDEPRSKTAIYLGKIAEGKTKTFTHVIPPIPDAGFSALAFTDFPQGGGKPNLRFVVAPAASNGAGAVFAFAFDPVTGTMSLKFTLR